DLGPEVEQTVPRVDLAAAEREPIRPRLVDAGLARNGNSEAGLGHERPLARPEETGGVRERRDGSAEPLLESGLRAEDLAARLVIVELEQVRVRERVRLEAERRLGVEGLDLVPAEKRGLVPVPGEPGRSVGHGRD